MEIVLGIVTSRELSGFSFYDNAVYAFESILSKGLLRFKVSSINSIYPLVSDSRTL